MAEVLFYHLTQSTLNDALPGLVERSLARNWHVVLQFVSIERMRDMDAHLWTWSEESFTAHGTEQDKYSHEQPVYLTINESNPNGSQVRFLLEGASVNDVSNYERLVVMFDGRSDEQLGLARTQWKIYKEAGHNLTYWQQTEDRKWEKKA